MYRSSGLRLNAAVCAMLAIEFILSKPHLSQVGNPLEEDLGKVVGWDFSDIL